MVPIPPEAQAEITAPYQRVLGCSPDPSGLASWTAQLIAAVPLSTIRADFADPAKAEQGITGPYQIVYGQPPPGVVTDP